MVKTIIRATDTVKELLLLYGVIITISSLAFAFFFVQILIPTFAPVKIATAGAVRWVSVIGSNKQRAFFMLGIYLF